MLLVRDLLKLKKETGELGIEIEVEGDNIPPNTLKYWRKEQDGSLRGESGEFVLKKPLDVKGVQAALAELDQAYKDNGTEVSNSIRAGVHVHVNVQDLSVNQLMCFITTYLILENILVKWCGKSREGNLFCLRCKDAEAWLQTLETALARHDLRLLGSDHIRYASVNLKALTQYGSIEFRAMRGTRDLDAIYQWATVLRSIKEFSKQYATPMDVMGDCLTDVSSFAMRSLGDNFKAFTYEGYQKDIDSAIRYANDLAHFSDWKEVVMKMIGGLAFPEHVMFPDEPNEEF